MKAPAITRLDRVFGSESLSNFARAFSISEDPLPSLPREIIAALRTSAFLSSRVSRRAVMISVFFLEN
jgi:hypothetical protein